MLFLTASAIGLVAGMGRSSIVVIMTAFLVVATFAAASLAGSAQVHYLNLVIAILGYNFGLIVLISGMVLTNALRPA